MTAKVDIKTQNVVIADDFDDFDPFEEPKEIQKCEICGTQLTDGGECPVCDLGDEIINENYQEILEQKRLHFLLQMLS